MWSAVARRAAAPAFIGSLASFTAYSYCEKPARTKEQAEEAAAAATAAVVVAAAVAGQKQPPQRTLSTLTKEQADGQKQVLQALLGQMIDDVDRTGGVGELQQALTKLEDELWARGRVHRVVITGGPCAGKSTIMSDLVQMLKERNYLVFTMPEVATEMFKWSDGKMWDDFSAQGLDDDPVWASLQTSLTRVQTVIEDSIVHMAHRSLSKRRKGPNPPEGAVVLLDRGVIDNVAYCTDEAWAMVLEDLGTTTARLRDSRYDHVIHLVTAANGAEQYYTLEQAGHEGSEESARSETPEQARLLDGRTLSAWQETKSHFIVGNAGVTWPEKRQKAKAILGMLLGDASSGGLMQKLQCAYLPPEVILAEAAADGEIPWAVSEHVKVTYLSEKSRLQKTSPGNGGAGAVLYFHQDLDADGHVVRQYAMDYWTYTQKLRTVLSSRSDALAKAGVGDSDVAEWGGQLREVREDIVIFAFGDNRIRCRCSEDRSQLEVEVCSSLPAEQVLPPWLRHVKTTPV